MKNINLISLQVFLLISSYKILTCFLRSLVLTSLNIMLNTNLMWPTELHVDGYIHVFCLSCSSI